jgi:hypothetical protein
VGGLALLLLLVVLFLPWWTRSPAASGGIITENRPAVQAPYAWPAILAALALVLVLVDLFMQRMFWEMPTLGGSRRSTRFVVVAIAVALLVLKLLLHPSNLAWGFVFAMIVAGVLLLAALRVTRGASLIPSR